MSKSDGGYIVIVILIAMLSSMLSVAVAILILIEQDRDIKILEETVRQLSGDSCTDVVVASSTVATAAEVYFCSENYLKTYGEQENYWDNW